MGKARPRSKPISLAQLRSIDAQLYIGDGASRMNLRGEHHCIGYCWDNQRLCLRLRDWAQPDKVELLTISDDFRFRLTKTRRCIGHYNFETNERVVCPDDATIDKKTQCEVCLEKEGFVPWMRCNGRDIPELLPAVRAYVDSPHYLYLACFGDSQVKVGMASAKRKQARLDDQGPLVAQYVAKGTGIEIRQLEVEISRLGYIELMRRSRKRKLLVEGELPTQARPRLATALSHIRGQLADEYLRLLLDTPEDYQAPPMAQEARSFSELETIELQPEKIYDVKVLAGSGSVAVVNDGGVRSTIECSELVGSVLELDPQGEVEREARQIGLF